MAAIDAPGMVGAVGEPAVSAVEQSGGDGPTDHAERAVERATMTGK